MNPTCRLVARGRSATLEGDARRFARAPRTALPVPTRRPSRARDRVLRGHDDSGEDDRRAAPRGARGKGAGHVRAQSRARRAPGGGERGVRKPNRCVRVLSSPRRAPSLRSTPNRTTRARASFGSGSSEETALVAGSRARGRTGWVCGPRVRLLQARDERGFEPGRVQPLSRERLAELRDGHLPQSHRGPGGRGRERGSAGEWGREEPFGGRARNDARLLREWPSVRARRDDTSGSSPIGRSVAKKKAPQRKSGSPTTCGFARTTRESCLLGS